ncbi:MAG: ABC transporter ATP-binding protein [Anaerolineae bacterium]|nr:ABC transporter ATP-binding protein [Anaerolineae bacterium]
MSFQLERGETIGFIGANGAGKSTALKLMAGIIEPDTGRVGVHGTLGALLELGAGFHPDLSGRENVYLNGSILGLSRQQIARKLDEIVTFAELERFIDVPVKHYSSGMYVRLGFAVAVNVNPEILLVDEVLAVGDQVFQQKCLQKITEMKRDGITIVLVSHGLGNIVGFCDRAIWLKDGAIYEDGASEEISDHYTAFSNEAFYRQLGESSETEATDEATEAVSHGIRWGTYQAEIVKVELLGARGESPDYFSTGDFFRLRIHYFAHERIVEPAFGLALYRGDGVHINGPNSVRAGHEIAYIDGPGYMDYVIEHLPLNPGTYELTVAIYDHDSTKAYDHHHRMYLFDVRSETSWSEEGVVHIDAGWSHARE